MQLSVLIALVGFATAQSCTGLAAPAPADCQFGGNGASYLNGAGAGGAARLSGALNANGRLAAASRGAGFGKLSAQSAASNTRIGASNIVIPDKNTITDTAKVSEAVSGGSSKEQTCQVAQRKFTIGGEITVTEQYNDSTKGEHTTQKNGEAASQTRSRTQVLDNCGGSAAIPVTAQCGAAAGGAGAGYGNGGACYQAPAQQSCTGF